MANNTTENQTTTLDQVSTVEFSTLLATWFLYCCTGDWGLSRPLRILALLEGIGSLLITNVWQGKRDLGLSLFMTYVLGRYKIDTSRLGICQGVMVLIWMVLDTTTAVYPFLKPADCVYEGIMTLGLLAHLVTLTMALKERGRRRWLLKLGAILLWGVGWGCISILYWLNIIDAVVVVAWFMSYAAVFPKQASRSTPGSTPPPCLQSPWLASIAQRRSRKKRNQETRY